MGEANFYYFTCLNQKGSSVKVTSRLYLSLEFKIILKIKYFENAAKEEG